MGALGRLLRWWFAELRSLVPGERRPAARRTEALAIAARPDAIVVGRVAARANAGFEELARIPRLAGGGADASPLGEEAGSEALAGVLRRHFNPRSMAVEVRLPRAHTLSRTVTLPLAAEENLRGVLGFEMERLTPFKAADVYFDAEVLARDPQARQLEVRLTLAPRRTVDETLALLPELPERDDPQRVRLRPNEEGVGVAFLPWEKRPMARSGFTTALVLVNVALLVAALGIPLLDQRRALAELEAEVQQARVAAGEATAVQTRIDELRAEVQALLDFKGERAAAVEIVEELAQRLPDSTWVHRLEIKDATVQISGSSHSASALIELLQGSALLTDARFVSQVTQERGSARERFHISARVVPVVLADGGSSRSGPLDQRGLAGDGGRSGSAPRGAPARGRLGPAGGDG